ncbi:MAG: hypothetical protein VX223_04040, partial [Myxococcota bacterium]|nr:hypothetical protein [Myxococcota bacterium]
MIRQLVAWSGVGCVSLGVLGYWAYTLGGQEWLKTAMGTPRRILLLGGTALSVMALPGPLGIVPAVSSALMLGYGIKRQWVFP